jgi:ribonuclease HII
MLKPAYCIQEKDEKEFVREIGVDEAGRGPMLGRVYTAAVILPPDYESFNHALMKDSKKFHSEKKIKEAAAYIKEKAIAWAIAYSDEKVIDEINIRNATHRAMHTAIMGALPPLGASPQTPTKENLETGLVVDMPPKGVVLYQKGGVACVAGGGFPPEDTPLLLVDGNDFTPFVHNHKRYQHVCIEGGDNTYSSIAAASILAKVARDEYIAELCKKEPLLIDHYDLLKNKGYGTKKHMDGIKAHGITPYHRKTYGICRDYS